MNGNIKWHKPTGPAFHVGQEWFSGKHRCTIVKVEKYPGTATQHVSDYGVTYMAADGSIHEKDAWNFQVRYTHLADLPFLKSKP